VFNNVLLWLLKGVATDVNCLSNSGQEGERRNLGWLAGLRRIIKRSTVECFVLGAVQTGRQTSVTVAGQLLVQALWLALPLSTPTPPPSPLTLTSAASLVGG